jgi:hypothetical protein
MCHMQEAKAAQQEAFANHQAGSSTGRTEFTSRYGKNPHVGPGNPEIRSI